MASPASRVRINGGFMAFAVIVGGSEWSPQLTGAEALGSARADLNALLARY